MAALDPAAPVPLGAARAAAARLLARLEREPAALRLALAGEARRMQPWVERLEILATAHAAEPLLEALAGARGVAAVLARSPRAIAVRLDDGLCVRLEVLADEAEVAARLAEPEEPAPDRLSMRDVLGVAGLHHRGGRGRYGEGEMAARAEREGYAWALLLPPPAAPADAAVAVLGGHEVEVGQDGDLGALPADLPPEAWVLASPVPALRADGPAAGRALARALASGRVDVAVPRGPGVPDVARPYEPAPLVDAARRAGAAVGVAPPPGHAAPEPALLAAALAAGVPLLLLADALDLVSVDDLMLSVGLARRAGARPDQVLNALPAARVGAWRDARRAAARS